MDVKQAIAEMRTYLDQIEKLVDENGATRSLLPNDGRLAYSAAEVAALIGNSRKTIYTWIDEGRIPTVPLPGNSQLRIPRWWIEQTLAAKSAKSG